MLTPKSATDLLLAPVAAQVDENLGLLRDKEVAELELALMLALDLPTAETRAGRAGQVLRAALHGVDPHGWEAVMTTDYARLRLSGGSVSLDLGLGATLTHYIEAGSG